MTLLAGAVAVLVLSAALCPAADAGRSAAWQQYEAACASWEAVTHRDAEAASGTTELDAAGRFQALSAAWARIASEADAQAALNYGHAVLERAALLAAESRMEEAAARLQEAGVVMKSHPVDLTRRRGGSRLAAVAEVHARVIAATGQDPLAGADLAYELGREGAGFLALQAGTSTDASAFATPVEDGLLKAEEVEGTLLMMAPEGRVTAAFPAAFTPGAGSLRQRLKAVFEREAAAPADEADSRWARREAKAFLAGRSKDKR